MRYDQLAYFVYIGEKNYNPETGNYDEIPEIQSLYRANIMDTSAELQRLIYGHVSQGRLTVYVRGPVRGEPDYIDVNEKRYKIDKVRRRKMRSSYVVSEVQ